MLKGVLGAGAEGGGKHDSISPSFSSYVLLQRIFGHAFAAFTGCVGGHYSLDLSRELDREAAMRLSEWGHLDQMCLRCPTCHVVEK